MHTVAVIGGGFSGALTACHLLRAPSVRVVLIEPNRSPGRGLAYGTSAGDFLLNVAAGSMSAWADRPHDFVAWLRRHQPSADASTFATRSVYGEYITDLLRAAGGCGRLEVIRAEAIDLNGCSGQFTVRLSTGDIVRCCRIVLSAGHAPPRPLLPGNQSARDSSRILQHPLAELPLLAPGAEDSLAVIGTGLTALDVITWIRRRGHRGHIFALSRRGLTPHVHQWPAPSVLPSVPDEIRQAPTVRRLVRWLKELGREMSSAGVPPVRAVDALRPYTSELWSRMSSTERARFGRHGAGFWGVCRHRAAPASYAALSNGCADGTIEIAAARYVGYDVIDRERVRVWIKRRGQTNPSELVVNWLVNCTGPNRNLSQHPGTLVQALLRKRLLSPDPFRLGALTTETGELLDASGQPVSGVYAVGPWRAADLWESTAVPELRSQAAAVASHLCGSLDGPTCT